MNPVPGFHPPGRPAAAVFLAFFVLGLPARAGMELGANFWNPGWHRPTDCFRDVAAVAGEDPWNPQFLRETALYRSFRFMDWDHTNNSKRERWSERPPRSSPRQNPVAYEWMVDLCNRQNADLWLTLPHRSVSRATGTAPADYALRLCLLIKTGVDVGELALAPFQGRFDQVTRAELVAAGGVATGAPLRPDRRLYLEYSNETWNGGFQQAHYCCDEGLPLGLDTNRWTAGFRFHAWAAIRVFRAADLVFGTHSPRVVKVLATQSANSWIAGQHLQVLADPALNPWGVRATAIATAPYFGHGVDGEAPDAVTALRAAIQKSGAESAKHRQIAAAAGLQLIAYEGGQHVTKNAQTVNRQPVMADLYREYLDEMSRHFVHFSHYAHVGAAGKGGAWGAIEFTGQPLEAAPKYRALVAWGQAGTRTSAAPASRPNVLLIAVDDLNDWVGCLGGHPQVKTPHLDALAARGTVFLNAHVQAPLCNPSRASLLTGLRPSTTGIYGLAPGLRAVPRTRTVLTLPQAFGGQGYATFTSGKVFHDGSIPAAQRSNEFQVWGDAGGYTNLPARKLVTTPDPIRLMDWGVAPGRDEDQPDWKIADAAIAHLRAAPADRPFFIATGFRLPHVPCYATQKWFDLYPDAGLRMPEVLPADRADTPPFSWYLHWKLPEPRLSWLEAHAQWRPLVRAYLASVSFMDSQVGRVLEELNARGREADTVVVLWSDNGWHLGEKGITGKNSLWERSTRVPLIFAGPGIAGGGRCRRPVELLDLYPTLLELCGLPATDGLQGHSLGPQLRDADAPRDWPALTTHNQGNHSIRSERWRYLRYADGSEELYDLATDPREWTNLVARADLAPVVAEHRRWLPAEDVPPAPGSAHRVLTYDPATGQAVWEGRPVVAAEREE